MFIRIYVYSNISHVMKYNMLFPKMHKNPHIPKTYGTLQFVQMASPKMLTIQNMDLFSHLTAQLPVGKNTQEIQWHLQVNTLVN